jgi:hypothetical protein
MLQVVVGVVLTALLGGLLVPTIKTGLDRRRDRFNASRDLLETLAASLWTYWKLAMRVAYYGKQEAARREDYVTALAAWDSTEAWTNGGEVQIQVSRSKRLLPGTTHAALDRAQQAVVDDLDKQVERLRGLGDEAAWERFYESLTGEKRHQIDDLLFSLKEHLDLAQQGWLHRRWREAMGTAPEPIHAE